MICHQNKDITFDHDASVVSVSNAIQILRILLEVVRMETKSHILLGIIWFNLTELWVIPCKSYKISINLEHTHISYRLCGFNWCDDILEKGFCKKTNKLDEQRNEPPLSCLNLCRLGTRVDVVKRHNSMKLRFSVQCNMSNNIYIQWTENHSIASTEIVHFTSWSGQILQHMGKCSKIICIEMSNFMWNLPIKRVFHGYSSYWEWMCFAVCMSALCLWQMA